MRKKPDSIKPMMPKAEQFADQWISVDYKVSWKYILNPEATITLHCTANRYIPITSLLRLERCTLDFTAASSGKLPTKQEKHTVAKFSVTCKVHENGKRYFI